MTDFVHILRTRRLGLLVLVFGMAAWALAFRAPLLDIVLLGAGDIERSYIFLVPAVAAYLAYLRRSRWRNLERGGEPVGLGMVLCGFYLSEIGWYYDIMAFWHAGPILAFVGLLVSSLGLRLIYLFGPVLIVLFAAVPVPGVVRQEVAQPLQKMAAEVTAVLLDLVGIPVIQNGNLLVIEGRMVAVGEACNGMRLMLPLALVIFAFVFSIPLKFWARCLLLLASIPVAIFCNVVRLVPTAIAYGYYPDLATAVHDFGGWAMIPFATWILLLIIRFAVWLDLPMNRWRLATS